MTTKKAGTVGPPPVPLKQAVDSAKDRRELHRLCVAYRENAAIVAAADAAKKELMAQIKVLAEKHELTKVAGDGWTLVSANGGSTTISPELLLAKGVKMSVIEAATVKKSWRYFQILEKE